MKSSGTTKVTHKHGGPPSATATDWAAVDALTDKELRRRALSDRDAQPLPTEGMRGMTKIVNVKKLRERLGWTQETFAVTYGIPLGTLRDWEQRRKHPDAPARAYLTVIARNPEVVAAMLRGAA
jgi:putative transcriptional regulator